MTDLRPEAVTVSLNMLICSVAYDAKIVTYDVDNAQLSIQIRHWTQIYSYQVLDYAVSVQSNEVLMLLLWHKFIWNQAYLH